jgi:glycine/D-amino acid oxidase-like deaminating enzyme
MLQALDRRRFVAAGGAAIGALALPGCATTPAPASSAACLPPVLATRERLIRSVVGLRPYRAGGFVVREDQLGDARLIHNYGHGGAGITLSWGTSRLAADIAIRGGAGATAVIGAGVIGLTTARLLQEAGIAVTIYAKALSPETTSDIAGGQWHPAWHFRASAVTPEWRAQYRAALDYSWRRFQLLVGQDYGIRWLPTYTESNAPEPALLPTFPPVNEVLGPGQHPFPVASVARYDTLYVEPSRFLRQLLRDFQIAGGKIEVRSFAAPAELATLPERVIVNCTGLGARELFGDTELRPARGQLEILLPQNEIQYAFSGEAGYMFPRPDGIVLGGTFELDQWSTEPDPLVTERLLASHRTLFEGFRCPT